MAQTEQHLLLLLNRIDNDALSFVLMRNFIVPNQTTRSPSHTRTGPKAG